MDILVIGSKPNPVIPKKFNHIVYVNASIYIYPQIDLTLHSTHFITKQCFVETWNENKEHFKNKHINNLVLILRNTSLLNEIIQKLNSVNYNYDNLLVLSSREKADITRNVVGKFFLYSTGITKPDKFKKKVKNIKKLIQTEELGGYKPSTGVFACLYCIKNYSNLKKLIIAGIGLSEGVHAYNKKYIYPASHNHFDRQILKKISRKNNVCTTEEELHKLTNIKLCS